MTAIRLALQRHVVPAAALTAAAAAALLAVAALSLNQPQIVVAPIAIALVVLVTRLSEQATIKLLIGMLAVQGFPAYFTGYFPTGTLFADDAVALVLIVVWLIRNRLQRAGICGPSARRAAGC